MVHSRDACLRVMHAFGGHRVPTLPEIGRSFVPRDPAFAPNPCRLEFFARHPSRDARLNPYPALRTDVAL
jgi:hypothetical protein